MRFRERYGAIRANWQNVKLKLTSNRIHSIFVVGWPYGWIEFDWLERRTSQRFSRDANITVILQLAHYPSRTACGTRLFGLIMLFRRITSWSQRRVP